MYKVMCVNAIQGVAMQPGQEYDLMRCNEADMVYKTHGCVVGYITIYETLEVIFQGNLTISKGKQNEQ
jgi:hypothetical protein